MLRGGSYTCGRGGSVTGTFACRHFIRLAPYVTKYKPNTTQTASPIWYFSLFFCFFFFISPEKNGPQEKSHRAPLPLSSRPPTRDLNL
jgi:hypothetical protein